MTDGYEFEKNIDLANSIEYLQGKLFLARRTGEVNVDETIKLVTRAKGSRSIRRFAEELEVNPSSLSRILKGEVTEIRTSLLAKIVFYADKQSGVTIDELMKAQGLSELGNINILEGQFEKNCRRILVDELIQRGFTVKGNTTECVSDGKFQFDFSLETNAIKNGSQVWAFECKICANSRPVGTGRFDEILNRIMACYYSGSSNYQRISIIVNRSAEYKVIKEQLSHLSIPNEISVILIDVDKCIIKDEYVAPLCKAGDSEAVFNKNNNS